MGREVIFSVNQERMTANKDKILSQQPKQVNSTYSDSVEYPLHTLAILEGMFTAK